jgi:alpha-1,2-mannosyltransferase
MLNRPARWLTAKRVCIHGLLLAVCLWTTYAVDISTPGLRDRYGLVKGTDFLHFYTLGSLAMRGHGDLLYDMQTQAVVTRERVPQAGVAFYLPLYGPQVSLLFAPFALLPYRWALAAWLSLNVAIYALCCYAIWKRCANLQSYGWAVLILAVAFPGFFHLILWGQTSGLALLCFTLGFLAVNSERHFLTGLAIGSLIFKPQLALAAAAIFLFSGEWGTVLGAISAASAQLALAWVHYGTSVMQSYLRALSRIREVAPLLEPRLYQTHSLRSFWSLLLPWPGIAFAFYVVCAIAVLVIAIQCWRSRAALNLRYSVLLIATVLVAPHLTVYDLVILAPAFLLLGDWALQTPAHPLAQTVQALLYISYPLFLLGPFSRFTHVQLSVLVMAALVWICWQEIFKPASASPA